MTIYSSVITNPIALSSVTTNTVMQLGTYANNPAKLIEWSVSFDGIDSADTPAQVVVAYEASDSTPVTTKAGNGWVAGHLVSTASVRIDSGNTPVSADTYLTSQFITPIGGLYTIQSPLGREIEIAGGDRLGIQVKVADTVNATGYITWEE